jgi:hypothetical protein
MIIKKERALEVHAICCDRVAISNRKFKVMEAFTE